MINVIYPSTGKVNCSHGKTELNGKITRRSCGIGQKCQEAIVLVFFPESNVDSGAKWFRDWSHMCKNISKIGRTPSAIGHIGTREARKNSWPVCFCCSFVSFQRPIAKGTRAGNDLSSEQFSRVGEPITALLRLPGLNLMANQHPHNGERFQTSDARAKLPLLKNDDFISY